MDVLYQNKNGEVLIVTLRRKPNRFEPNAWLGLLYYFMQFHCIYTLKCSFQSVGRFIAARLTTPLLFWISLSKAFTNTVHSSSDERSTSSPVRFDTSYYFNCTGYTFVVFIFGNGNSPSYCLSPKVVGAINGCPNTILFL